MREPMLILDGDLRVMTANQSFYRLFRGTPASTQGRFIYDLNDRAWDIPRLRDLLEKILPEKATFEDFRIEHDFPGIGRKTMLLNARRLAARPGQPPLILLVLQDVTSKPEQP